MFGEKILYQLAGKRPSRLDPRFIPGTFFGVAKGSAEILVGTAQGVVKARSFKRLPADGRADLAAFRAVTGVPWRPVPGDAGEDVPSDIPGFIKAGARPVVPEELLPPQLDGESGGAPRQVYIRRNVELLQHGFTEGCAGCLATRANEKAVARNEVCRRHIVRAMASEEKGADRIRAAAGRRTETGAGGGRTAQQAADSAAPEALSPDASSDARAVAGRTALQRQAGGGSTAQLRVGGGRTAQPAAGSAAPEEPSASSDARAVAGRTALRNLPGDRRDAAKPPMEVDTLPTGRKLRPDEHAEEAHLQRCLGPAAGSTARDAGSGLGFATAGAAGSTAPTQGAGDQPDHRDVGDIAAVTFSSCVLFP